MPRGLLIALLTIGTVGGFASGFASLRCHGNWRRAHFEQRIQQRAMEACERGARQAVAARPLAEAAAPAAGQ